MRNSALCKSLCRFKLYWRNLDKLTVGTSRWFVVGMGFLGCARCAWCSIWESSGTPCAASGHSSFGISWQGRCCVRHLVLALLTLADVHLLIWICQPRRLLKGSLKSMVSSPQVSPNEIRLRIIIAFHSMSMVPSDCPFSLCYQRVPIPISPMSIALHISWNTRAIEPPLQCGFWHLADPGYQTSTKEEAMAAKLQKQQQPWWCDGALVKRFFSWEKCGWMTRNSAHKEKSRRHVNLVSLVSLFCLHGISRGRFGGGWGIGGVGGGRNLPHGSRELRLEPRFRRAASKKNCPRTARQSDWIRFLSDRIDYLHHLGHIWSYLHDLLQSSCCAEFDLDSANWDCLDHLLQVCQGELTQKKVSDNQNRNKVHIMSECLWMSLS